MIHSVIILQMLFACSTPINKFLLGLSSPLALMSARLLFAGTLLLSGYTLFSRNYSVTLNREQVKLFLKKVFFGSYLKYFLKYWGLQYMTSVKMAFLLYTTPFFAALLSYWLYQEVLSFRQKIGIIVGFLGMVPILCVRTSTEYFLTSTMFSLPEIAVLCAVIAHCYGTLCTQQLIRVHKYSAPLIGGISAICAGLLALITALCLHLPLNIQEPQLFLPWFLVLIVISNLISHVWYIRLLKHHSATFLALADYLNPLFIALYSVLFLGEKLSIHYLVAAPIILSGLCLFNSKNLSQ